jgi:hypothetical protein
LAVKEQPRRTSAGRYPRQAADCVLGR